MNQHTLRCIYEFQECLNNYNCSLCEIKKAYYESLIKNNKKRKHKRPKEWDSDKSKKHETNLQHPY